MVNISSLFGLTNFGIDDAAAVLDYALPSALEAEQLAAGSPEEKPTVEETAARLLRLGCRNVVIKLGKKGCYIKNGKLDTLIQSRSVEAVDTTGAGVPDAKEVVQYFPGS